MKGQIIMRTMQPQMVSLSGELGRGIIREIKAAKVKPYSSLHKKAQMIEAEILKARADEKKRRTGSY